MFRSFWKGLTEPQRKSFLAMSGVTPGVMKRYLRVNSEDRSKPGQDRFDLMLEAANTIKPNAISRAQLAEYFYAAPGRTGQDNPEAA